MRLRRFGFFPSHPGEAKSILESLVSKQPHPNKRQMLSYLRSGVELCAVAGPGVDYLAGETKIQPPDVYTDGVWVWTLDVAYFVDKYDIRTPDEFLEHMKRNQWTVPKVTNPHLLKF